MTRNEMITHITKLKKHWSINKLLKMPELQLLAILTRINSEGNKPKSVPYSNVEQKEAI